MATAAACVLGSATILGYMWIEGWNFLDSMYMTAITLTTVGFGEVRPLSQAGRIYTAVVIFFGVGTVLYIFASVSQTLFEGHLRAVFGKRKLERRIQKMKDHFILCGYGRIGSIVAQMLTERSVPLVVIDNDPFIIELLDEAGIPYVQGEATSEDTLLSAGLLRAKGVITCLSTNAENLYVTMTVRDLNENVFICARAEDEPGESRLSKAGADRVILPSFLGARRMAMAVLRPTVTDFIDQTIHDPSFDLQMEELPVLPTATLKDVTLMNSGIRKNLDLIVVAIKKPDGAVRYNPAPDAMIEVGDTLIALGPRENMVRLGRLLGTPDETGSRQPL